MKYFLKKESNGTSGDQKCNIWNSSRMNEINSRIIPIEEKISKLENKGLETTQIEAHKEREWNKNKQNPSHR